VKTCSHCGIEKSDSEFARRKTLKGSRILDWLCKHCMLEYNRNYRKTPSYRKSELKRKIKAYKTIQPQIRCVRCGCNDIRFLEINHKNGGGCKEAKALPGGVRFYRAIIYGRRKTEDLELLCKPCNNIHYLEQKYGKVTMKVIWQPNNQTSFLSHD